MKRRDFMTSTGLAFVAAASTGRVFAAGAAAHVEYTPQAFAGAKASGEPFMLDFFAPW